MNNECLYKSWSWTQSEQTGTKDYLAVFIKTFLSQYDIPFQFKTSLSTDGWELYHCVVNYELAITKNLKVC